MDIHSLTAYIARSIASHPDDIRVQVDETDATMSVAISAHPDDMGRLIGKDGKNIPEKNAAEYIFGYAVGLDMTLRDIQTSAKKA